MLVGREDECARIDRLLEQARVGRSGALVLGGEPGIGKSALLEYAAERATAMAVIGLGGLDDEVVEGDSNVGVRELVAVGLKLQTQRGVSRRCPGGDSPPAAAVPEVRREQAAQAHQGFVTGWSRVPATSP